MAVEIRHLVVKTSIQSPCGDCTPGGGQDEGRKTSDVIEHCRSMLQDLARQGRDR